MSVDAPAPTKRFARWLDRALNVFTAPEASRVVSSLGYDAVDQKNKRQPSTGKLMCEEDELPADKRRRLVSGTRDIQRNFAIAAWGIRKHLDFVSSMNFAARTHDTTFNAAWEKRMAWWSKKENCDASNRHSLRRVIRLTEAGKTVTGDHFNIKLADRKLFALEGDRVRDPSQYPPGVDRKQIIQGVQVDRQGRPVAYAVHNRKGGGAFEFDRMFPADSVLHHAWWDRFDQTRGVSPIAAALNTFRDIYEGADYALAKMKIAQLFGLVFYRGAVDSVAPVEEQEEAEGEEGEEADTTRKKYNIDFGKGPVLLDLDYGDRAEFLENKTPSAEFREFMQVMIAIALKSIDLPFSFFDEAYTNFFGSKSAFILYQRSCESKQDDLRESTLHPLTLWNLAWDVADGELTLPAGIETVEDAPFEWVPSGTPWWNPAQEINSDVASVAAGLRTRTEIRKERYGDDWATDVMPQLKREQELIVTSGVTIVGPGKEIFNPPIVQGAPNAEG